MTTTSPAPTSRADRFLDVVERVGNRLPQPFNLFLILFLVIGAISTGLA
jgi:aminobenzoyl-glutamate transport protein